MNARFSLAALGLLLAPVLAPQAAHADADPIPPITLMENFESGDIENGALVPCHRPENKFADQSAVYRMGRMGASLTVNPVVTRGFLAVPPSKECLDPGQSYTPDGTERAELWERQESRLPFGTDVWYGFSMYIGPTVSTTDDNRLVIGQWKEAGGNSPILAQRFKNRSFFVTIEQDGPTPGSQCRILLAYQSEPPPMLDSEGDNDQPCMTDVVLERFDYLPNPFDTWTDMVYHLRPDPAGKGVMEVWAGGKLVARAEGRIGFANPPLDLQYFKFGPYRDAASYSTVAYMDAFRRGSSYDEVVMGGRHQAPPVIISQGETAPPLVPVSASDTTPVFKLPSP